MIRTSWIFCRFVFLAFACLLVGCSSNNDGIVKGSVTVDGKPAETGAISFFPLDEKSRTTGARIDAGKFEAHVPPGAQRVEVRVPKVITPSKDPVLNPPVMAESLPAKYNSQSELKIDVKAGTNEQNFDLKTK